MLTVVNVPLPFVALSVGWVVVVVVMSSIAHHDGEGPRRPSHRRDIQGLEDVLAVAELEGVGDRLIVDHVAIELGLGVERGPRLA